MDIKHLIITNFEAKRTVLQLLRTYNSNISDSRLYKACRRGEVRVNKSRVKFNYRLKLEDQVRLPIFQERCPEIKPIPDWLQGTIIYEDAGVIAINKPSGLSVHAGNMIKQGLIEIMRQDPRWHELNLDLVHRLDRATSGLVLIAKNTLIKTQLSAQFADRVVDKTYIALLAGHLDLNTKLLEHTLDTSHEFKVVCADSGKKAVTEVASIEHYWFAQKPVTKVTLKPKTGRKHQLRVQCQAIGHPIIGDELYGVKGKMLFLHAYKLCYTDPINGPVVLTAPLPEEKVKCLNSLQSMS